MANQEHLRFRKGDGLAIAIVAALAVFVAVCFLPKNSTDPVMAEVYHSGELVRTLPLEEDVAFELEGAYHNIITVENGAVSITSSDCPGEDCVHSGAIRASGRSIVCLPNGLEIRVVSAESDVDFVVR